MGEFLSTPIKDKVSEDGENSLVCIYIYIYITYSHLNTF